jgi:hypothetical protein
MFLRVGSSSAVVRLYRPHIGSILNQIFRPIESFPKRLKCVRIIGFAFCLDGRVTKAAYRGTQIFDRIVPNPERFRQTHVLLLIDLLEEEPDDCVRFAIADTLGKLASRAQEVGVIDAERIIPGWKADGNPFVIREHFSRDEFAPEIVDRLDYLCVTEAVTEKVMPLACLLWKGLGE